MIEVIALSAFLTQAGAVQPRPTPPVLPYQGEWIVEIIDNIKIMPDSRITMTIRGGTVNDVSALTGSASCNTYRATFTVNDTVVTIGQLLKTMKACDPPRMSEEHDFFSFLSRVVSFEVDGKDTLVLMTREGKRLTARRRTDSP